MSTHTHKGKKCFSHFHPFKMHLSMARRKTTSTNLRNENCSDKSDLMFEGAEVGVILLNLRYNWRLN